MDAISAGCHVMVEKPISSTVREAQELVGAAAAAGRVLMVGHIERYNPAVVELKRRLREGQLGRIFQIHSRRLGPFPERVRDVGVVLDLATHDVDILRYLAESEVARLFAETGRKVHDLNEDLACAVMRFQNDVLGVLEISWLTPTKVREVTVTGERGMFRAEYLTQDLYFYENARAADFEWEHLQILRGVSEGPMTRFTVLKQEPLRLELNAFIAATNGDPSGIVSGADGLTALRLALAMLESGSKFRVVEPDHELS
jgi:predicted dehydrogenase